MVKFFTSPLFCLSAALFFTSSAGAQLSHTERKLTRQDTLRGTLNANRTWWDVQKYDIQVTPDYAAKTIEGKVDISYKISGKSSGIMQIDLQEPMELDKVSFAGIDAKFKRDGNIYLVTVPASAQSAASKASFSFHGKPREAIRPPWDGGWIWRKDEKGNPWMSVACQGLGASVWYPCKDHQSDEPDQGASLSMTVADSLSAIGNGRLKDKKSNGNGMTTWTWNVVNPINNYNIIPYIGKYTNFTETFNGEKGALDCSYWVLEYNLEKAREQFKQVPKMLKCFENWFGPYPFYDDSYKLVDAPHLGMEHQSAVAYGNKYRNGYLGQDLSGTGWGLKWDFIIVHESGHEWFANNITSDDIADMWVHEGFTNYSETLFTTCEYGVEAGNDYVIGTRKSIQNDIPVIGKYGVNMEGSGDMYYKGGNLLHTIRQLVGNDEKFRQILRGLNQKFYHKTTTSKAVEAYISQQSGINLSKVFDQYLRTVKIPVLEYKLNGKQVSYRWTNCVKGFNLKVKTSEGKWLLPKETWQAVAGDSLKIDRNFYIETKKVD
ncbi:MAG: M1 family metallopeptidase [Gemmatimonadaceae bacterium]|nr:M1 family metallopeptidase [Chitinophagaceae bacterium]